MGKSCVVGVLAILLFASSASSQIPAKTFTEKDREFALKYLNETKADYLAQLEGLNEQQLNFRPAEGRWTIAEIAEHITVVETALFDSMTAPGAARVLKCDDVPRIADTALILAITNRSQKFAAPEPVRPNGRWKTRAALISSFEKTRSTTIDYVKNNKADLRSTFVQSPMGMVDSLQGILFISGHAERHLAQLKEVKADGKFPLRMVSVKPNE